MGTNAFLKNRNLNVTMKKPTVTIGIPAFNEEANIAQLLEALCKQDQSAFDLERIVVISDNSTDKTALRAGTVNKKMVKVIENRKRQGKSQILNQLMQTTQSDIFVQVDADVLIKDSRMLLKLIAPITRKEADLTSAQVKEYWTHSKLEQILKISMLMKKEIFGSVNNGNNIFTCHGRARAFSRRLYKKMYFDPNIVAEDAFSYLFAVSNKFTYKYAKNAYIYYKLPSNIADHQKQSVRFFNSYKQLEKIFGQSLLKKECELPKLPLLKKMGKYFAKYPISMTLYVGILIFMKFKARKKMKNEAKWSTATSSKTFN